MKLFIFQNTIISYQLKILQEVLLSSKKKIVIYIKLVNNLSIF